METTHLYLLFIETKKRIDTYGSSSSKRGIMCFYNMVIQVVS
jgi:hypothetical protein